MSSIHITSWNINSVRIRLGLIQRFVELERPDILCLQETKVQDELFPSEFFLDLGFRDLVFSGQKSYNGVAILSKIPLTDKLIHPFGGNDDARHVSAKVAGMTIHNFYVPAGGDEPDPSINPKFAHKLQFMDDITSFFVNNHQSTDPILFLGDMNIAPLEHDVWSHKQLLNVVSHTPIEVERMEKLRHSLGWIDTHRHFVPETEKLYSWWSYRNRDWKKSNRGRRLDHIWITPALQEKLISSHITNNARDWEKPSDHAPISCIMHI